MNLPDDAFFEADAARRFSSINGWIDLGSYNEAAKELNDLPPVLKSTIEFVRAWIRIYVAKKAWTDVEMLCLTLLRKLPDDTEGILHLAEALHGQGKHIDAISTLGPQLGDPDWEGAPTVRYNLAKYFCAMGQLKEARECLRKAIEGNKSLKKQALDDKAFEKLWTEGQKGIGS